MRLLISWFIVFASATHAEDKADIHQLLDGFHLAAANADFNGYFSRFSDKGVFLGTDASERWTLEEFRRYAKPAFDNGRGWTYKVMSRNIVLGELNNTAWFDEVLTNEKLGRCRGTGVVVRIKDHWKVAYYSLTLLIPNEIAAEVGELTTKADNLNPLKPGGEE